MRFHWRFLARMTIFISIFYFFLSSYYQLISPKFMYNNMWPTTSTYLGFYEMNKNSVEVLFLGSSHAASSFIPQELYENYGITSYNLGCEQQNLIVSYFWLKEALRFQTPKVVVLDCYMLFDFDKFEPLNTGESFTRKAIDFMKWSAVKREAVKAICNYDKNQTELSYYMPNIRYHTRWTSLSAEDFLFKKMKQHFELKGYAPLSAHCNNVAFMPFEEKMFVEDTPMMPLMQEYLNKINKICTENSIKLILTKTPTTAHDLSKHNSILKYADENGLLFIDFNSKDVYNKSGFIYTVDNNDDGHANIWGAQKITNYVGNVMRIEQLVQEEKNCSQWVNTKSYYHNIQEDCNIVHINELKEYLYAIKNGKERYDLFICIKNGDFSQLSYETIRGLKELGLQISMGNQDTAYAAAVHKNGMVIEKSGISIEDRGTICQGVIPYNITSIGPGVQNGYVCSIKINGNEYSRDSAGLNIVVYSEQTQKVIDSVCFDMSTEKALPRESSTEKINE